jgi:hypothetical protein
LPIPPTVSLALFAQLILVETGQPQLRARVALRRLLARFAVSAAIALAAFAELVPHFAGAAQFPAVLGEGGIRQADRQERHHGKQ